MIVFFVFYVDSISVAAAVAEIIWYRFVFAEREFHSWVLEKVSSIPQENWSFVIIIQLASCVYGGIG